MVAGDRRDLGQEIDKPAFFGLYRGGPAAFAEPRPGPRAPLPGWPNKKSVGACESTKISKMFAPYEFLLA
jgi:hypothetical protein